VSVNVQAGSPYEPDDEFEFIPPRERLRRGGGWLAAFLTFVMLIVVAWTVQAADWSEGLGLVQTAIAGGALVGLALALTSWGSFGSFLYSLVACVAWVCTLLVRGFLQTPDLHAGIVELLNRNVVWASNLVYHRPSADNLIFVLQLLILGWWMGHFAMWMVFRRHSAWLAAVPPALGLLFNAYYSPKNLTGYLLLFLLIVLMLAIRVELAKNEVRWQLAHIRYAPDIYLDFLRDGFVFAIAVVAITWLIPGGAYERRWADLYQPLDSNWRDVQSTWNRAFTNLRYPTTAQVTTFGKSLTLGGPVALTDRPIFEAQVDRRVYWRASAFDSYTGSQWLNTDSKVMSVDKGKPLPEPDYQLTKEVTATVRTLEMGQDVLFTPPQPGRASLPVNVDYTPSVVPAGTPTGSQSVLAVSLLRSRGGLAKDSVYQVVSRPSEAPPDLLRADDLPAPQEIKQRYMQVPDSLPLRVRELAGQITQPYDNAYDKATAVEAYVRSFPYNNQIAAPPKGEDGVDYFLFDIKQGYCDYYASAMAVMLRVAGVPTRFVVGYTPGEATTQPGTYLIREENAHAWVEVYFPEYGWVQFEPTASQPILERPAPLPAALQSKQEAPPTPEPRERPERQPEDAGTFGSGSILGMKINQPANPMLRWLVGHQVPVAVTLLLACLIALAVASLRRRERRLLIPDSGIVARLFDLLPSWAGRLHVPWPASHTPLEHAQALGAAVPAAAPQADHLAQLYVAQRYGRQDLPQDSLVAAAEDWRVLRPALWRRWLLDLAPVKRRQRRSKARAEAPRSGS
jgi:transglutaminase-like putative cysteine protease